MKKILVGVDGSENSMRAVEYTAVQAEKFDAHITLLLAIAPSDTAIFSGKGTYMPKETNIVEGRLKKAKEILKKRGIDYDQAMEFGQPANVILTYSQQGYDTIVLGSRGLSGVKGFLMGSVSSKVVHHSEVPVTIVP